MFRHNVGLAVVLLVAVLVSSTQAQRIPLYERNRGISPYFNLFRGNTGGLNSYFTFVRPYQDQLRFNQFQLGRDQRFEREIRYNQQVLPQQIADSQRALLRPPSLGIGQPATAASFFNYSHYYGNPLTATPLGPPPAR